MERLKQKVASSSSRVFASIQQAAAGSFQATGSAPPAAQDQAQEPDQGSSSARQLMSTEATAHLTETEREILLKVFKKEEQFQRDTIKQMHASRVQSGDVETPDSNRRSSNSSGPTPIPSSRNSRRQEAAGSFQRMQVQAQVQPSSLSHSPQCGRSSSTTTATPCSSSTFASARSATPLSRPSSSLFGANQRTVSACSAAHNAEQENQQTPGSGAVGQCRICRKLILANETCHLCSTCNQFICEDCGSYSASEQHWMCSSCRRRATKPAIPDDALRELGLNQNSSAVRRMTLRLNQNELKMALGKCSSESTTSSNSSSGCSSLSATGSATIHASANTATANTQRPRRASQQQPLNSGKQQSNLMRSGQQPTHAGSGGVGGGAPSRPGQTQQATNHQAVESASMNVEKQCDTINAKGCNITDIAPPAPSSRQTAQVARSSRAQNAGMARQQSDTAAAVAAPSTRRASVATGQVSPGLLAAGGRKMSTAFYTQNSTSKLDRRFAALNQRHQFVVQNRYPNQVSSAQAAVAVQPGCAQGDSPMSGSLRDLMIAQQQARRDSQLSNASSSYQQQQHQHQLVGGTGSSSRLNSQSDLTVQNQPMTTLIPIPPDQIHLRRLSDQSNLVRRSSIIADTIDCVTMARNRSHSNIDTVCYSNYLQQQQQQQPLHQVSTQRFSSFDNPDADYYSAHLSVAQQQRRASDQWVHQQRFAAQQQQQQTPMISSIITPYSQKTAQQPNSSVEDGFHSDSSSDIEEDPQANLGPEPHDYFATPRASSNLQQNHIFQDQQARPISIPSVSVSEFHHHNNSQQRLNNIGGQHQQMILTNHPMQINVAIEQAIQRQQQQQQELPDPYQAGYLIPRRGSSGRVLPKIPVPHSEQSRSLLDLGNGAMQNGGSMTNGHQANSFTLDLPANSVRRASAPEGQNIKIVVDDIDGFRMGSNGALGGLRDSQQLRRMPNGGQVAGAGAYAGRQVTRGGELLERLVLYRDDSIDPATNLARGFGLQVMGGKIVGQKQLEQRSNKDQVMLQACVSWVLPAGPADKVGLEPGDQIIEWDGKCLVNMTYEQVADVIESSANIAELLVKPVRKLELQPGAGSYVRTQRRLSQQTERDMRRFSVNQPNHHHQQQQQPHLARQQECWPVMSRASDLHCRSTGQLHQQPGEQRAGTGRRLPQIPGLALPTDSSSSTTQLATDQATAYQLLPDMKQQVQSRSTGDMFPAQQAAEQNYGGSQSRVMHQPPVVDGPALGQNGYHAQNGYLGAAMQSEVSGLIGLQVNVDERMGQLEISVLSAINMGREPSLDYYVRVKILPESNLYKPCTTQPNCDMNWKETFLFQNFPTQQINRMALEIGIWVYDDSPARLSTQVAQPICEALIPIQSARERNTDFWPLRPPPTSPQARRKSLNDLMETHRVNESRYIANDAPGYYQPNSSSSMMQQQQPAYSHQQHPAQAHRRDSGTVLASGNRSASSRNLPAEQLTPTASNKLRVQPRRASDEVASSSSQRLSARTSPAASRRSISAINVDGDGPVLLSRPSSKLGTPSRRDSSQQLTSGAKHNPQATDCQTTGLTPAGRRSSLAGIQSMTGYRSQKNSQSGSTTDTNQDSPLRASTAAGSARPQPGARKGSVASSAGVYTTALAGSPMGAGSRRGSSELQLQQVAQTAYQRKGSLAMQTLRKLKRTMSLTKGPGDSGQNSGDHQSAATSTQGSRRSSSSSNGSMSDLGEDVGLARRLVQSAKRTSFVGKLKLSFLMTKGQLEIEVISAQALHLADSRDSNLGIYVKMYLFGGIKSKSSKRKTRTVPASEAPVFKHLIKYDGSLVDNKTLEVSVWQKLGGLKGKLPLGFTEIRLNELNLEQLQISWYNLRPMDIVCSSSVEES